MAWISEWWNQVSGTVLHGMELTAAGMALVFFTLGLVILAMVLLTRLPWLQVKQVPDKEPDTPAEPAKIAAVAQPASQDDELARVAAIAVAMLRSRRRATRRARATAPRSAWKSYGRAQQLGL